MIVFVGCGGICAIFHLMSSVRSVMFLLVRRDFFRVFRYVVRLPTRCRSLLHMYDLGFPFLHFRSALIINLAIWESRVSYFVEWVLVQRSVRTVLSASILLLMQLSVKSFSRSLTYSCNAFLSLNHSFLWFWPKLYIIAKPLARTPLPFK
jgi:hypothetical protein